MLGGPIKADGLFFFISYQGTRERNGASPNSLTSGVLIAPGLTNDRSQQTLLTTFRPRSSPNAPLATSINPVALALLNAKLPNGQFLIPTPQADGHYSGSAISSYREDQFKGASLKDYNSSLRIPLPSRSTMLPAVVTARERLGTLSILPVTSLITAPIVAYLTLTARIALY